MLENLTYISFKPYGEIEPKGYETAKKRLNYIEDTKAELTRKVPDKLFISNYDTIIDVVQGTSVLYVGKTPEVLVPFIFDKTVIIKKGIYYYATPLLQKAIIVYAEGKGERREISIPPLNMNLYVNPKINVGSIYTLLFHEKEAGFKSKSEKHDIWELTYVDSGQMYNATGENNEFKTIMKQGDIMVFIPNQSHLQYADNNVSVCYATISFEMNFADKHIFENQVFKADNEIKKLMEKIILEKELNAFGSEDLTLCYLKEVIIKLIRQKKSDVRENQVVSTKNENDIVSYVESYINANIRDRITVAGLAKSIPLNASYLSTVYKKSTGNALSEYIISQKLIRAKEYIRTGKYTVTQVSEMLSFTNVQYFSRLFKNRFGITPSEYAWSIRK